MRWTEARKGPAPRCLHPHSTAPVRRGLGAQRQRMATMQQTWARGVGVSMASRPRGLPRTRLRNHTPHPHPPCLSCLGGQAPTPPAYTAGLRWPLHFARFRRSEPHGRGLRGAVRCMAWQGATVREPAERPWRKRSTRGSGCSEGRRKWPEPADGARRRCHRLSLDSSAQI